MRVGTSTIAMFERSWSSCSSSPSYWLHSQIALGVPETTDPDFTQDCDELEVLATDIMSLITTPRLTTSCAQPVSKLGSNW